MDLPSLQAASAKALISSTVLSILIAYPPQDTAERRQKKTPFARMPKVPAYQAKGVHISRHFWHIIPLSQSQRSEQRSPAKYKLHAKYFFRTVTLYEIKAAYDLP
jgi:hypothetical protein